jgi:hypothetical protein
MSIHCNSLSGNRDSWPSPLASARPITEFHRRPQFLRKTAPCTGLLLQWPVQFFTLIFSFYIPVEETYLYSCPHWALTRPPEGFDFLDILSQSPGGGDPPATVYLATGTAEPPGRFKQQPNCQQLRLGLPSPSPTHSSHCPILLGRQITYSHPF